MRTDFHTHAFHPKIASKVCEQLHDHYGACPVGDGTVEDLLARARAAGIDTVVALCAATVPAQMLPANDFAIHLQATYPQIRAFGTVHPYAAGWEQELDRLRAAGIKGLKFHPEFQGFWMDDPMLLPLLEASQDFIWMFHVGDVAPPEQNPSCPIKLGKILDQFPDARVVAAHLGGYRQWECALEHLAGRDVWFDTSSSMPFIRQETLETIFRKHDPERMLFGSDYPLFDPTTSMRELETRLGLDEAALEGCWRNAETLLAG
ncbi:MAG: amidohydrolase family protein [Desulfovibrio sp.]|nr:amidohydrolase family protein [Desulfovibrio sp.]MCA1985982.1 amidohydrolase family protein [Desulfovibrio sp.]